MVYDRFVEQRWVRTGDSPGDDVQSEEKVAD